MSKPIDDLLETIAREELRIPSLRPRGRDALDFHEVGVLSVRDALARAYAAGCDATAKKLFGSLNITKGDLP